MPSQPINVPMEMVRSVIAVAEAGSISKAAAKLGISQPAVSHQIKRLQILIGGELFVKTPNGAVLTGLGKQAVEQARRMVETNDQLLRLGGHARQAVCRLGVTQILAPTLFERVGCDLLMDAFLIAEQSSLVRKGLAEGYIDMGLLFLPPVSEVDHLILAERRCEVSWIKSPAFAAIPGAPLPLITLPDDDWLTKPLERKGISYRLVLRSSDHSVRMNAVRAGIGLMGMPNDYIPPDLVRTDDYDLPELAGMKMVLCARPEMNSRDKARLSRRIITAFLGSAA